MAKIADFIRLKTGYANFVELKNAFEEAKENNDRMAMYRPTKAHRVAFERICRGLYQPNDKKFYLLSGSYGTGKQKLWQAGDAARPLQPARAPGPRSSGGGYLRLLMPRMTDFFTRISFLFLHPSMTTPYATELFTPAPACRPES